MDVDNPPLLNFCSPNANPGRSRGEDFRLQVSITPPSTLEPTICVPDGMLVLWPSGVVDWAEDWEQRGSALPQSRPAYPPLPPAVFLQFSSPSLLFAPRRTVPGFQRRHRFHITSPPFASTMTQQLLQGFSAPPPPPHPAFTPSLPPSIPNRLLPLLTSALHHTHQTKHFFPLAQPDSETQRKY